MFLGIISWVVIGIIVGFVASKLVNLRGDDPRFGIAAAVGAAIAGALIYKFVSGAEVSALNPWALLSAAVGAAVGAAVWHAVRSRFISHASYTMRRSY